MQGSRREPVALRHPARVFWTIAVVVLALDQLTKALVRSSMVPGELRSLLPGLIDLTYVRNVGAAFGLFPGRQPVFIAVSVIVLVVIAGYWRRARPTLAIIVVALGLITAGAVGNLIDRAFIGRVTDFMAFAFIDFPVFNVADTAIVTGTAILIVWLLFAPEPERMDGEDVAVPSVPESEQQGVQDVSELRELSVERDSAPEPDSDIAVEGHA